MEKEENLRARLTIAALLTFYVQTWDEYHTHTLTLGLVSGPVEGILTLCVVYAVTAIKGGGSFWQRSMLETLGVANTNLIPDFLYDMAWTDWYMVYGGIMLVVNTIWRYICPVSFLIHSTNSQKR
jgi:ethanolaminephosphotransferase